MAIVDRIGGKSEGTLALIAKYTHESGKHARWVNTAHELISLVSCNIQSSLQSVSGERVRPRVRRGRELAVGVLADKLPHKLLVKLSNCPPSVNLEPYNLISIIPKPLFLPK